MSNELDNRLIARLAPKTPDLTPKLFQYDYGGRTYLTRYQGGNSASLNNDAYWFLSPESFTSGAFVNNAVTFRLKPGFCNAISMSYLEIVCSESGGANSVTPVAAPFLIDRIEVGLNGQPAPQQTLYPEWLYGKYQFYTTEQTSSALAFNAQNMTATAFAGESPIAAGGSATYRLPLTNILINTLDPNTITSDVIVSVYPATNPVSAGTGSLQLTSMRLILSSEQNPAVERATRSLLSGYKFTHNYINIVPQTWTGTLTAGTQTEIAINGVNQFAAAVLITVRASKAFTGSAIRTFADLGNSGLIDLVDQNKVSIFGSGALRSDFIRGQMQLETFGLMSTVVPLYWIRHAANIQQTLATGNVTGFYEYNGYQYLRITPAVGFASGAYTVDMYFLCYNAQEQESGSFKRLM